MKTLAPKLTMLVFTIFMTAMISCGGGGDVKKTVEENLTEAQKVQSVLVNLQTMTLVQGDSGSLSATVLPETAKDKTVKWTSNQPTVATVNNGAIQTVGIGEAL